MIVYTLKNRRSGKRYVGKTKRSVATRIREHSTRHDQPIGAAIKKYGLVGFDVEVLERCYDARALDEAERRWIAHFNTFKGYGYNCTVGGDGVDGYRHTDEAKVKIGNRHRGEGNVNYGKFGDDHPKFGHKMSEKSKRQLSESKKGKPCNHKPETRIKIAKSRWKQIQQLDDTGVVVATYESVKAAALAEDCFPQGIARCARGERKHAAGFMWRYTRA